MQNRCHRRNRRKYNLKVHIVLVTKYRKALLQNGIDDFVKRAISCLADQNDWTMIAMRQTKTLFTYCWNAMPQNASATSSASSNREQHDGSGYAKEIYSRNNTGRNTSSGQMDTLPVVLEKYHRQPLKSI